MNWIQVVQLIKNILLQFIIFKFIIIIVGVWMGGGSIIVGLLYFIHLGSFHYCL